MSDFPPSRRPFQGVRQIFDYNWPFYAFSLAAVAATQAVLRWRRWPRLLEIAAQFGCGGAVWWTAASLAASHWVYDRSPLMKWRWLTDYFPQPPRFCANIHCGLDESSQTLRALFPDAKIAVFDIFNADEMTEPSIRRARQESAPVETIRADYAAFPLQNGVLDAVFLLFAAHELRAAASRERFWAEIARVLAPGGRVILVEHPRDAANFAAFGPGFFHFWPRGEWRRLAELAGLEIERENSLTPFVRVWALKKP